MNFKKLLRNLSPSLYSRTSRSHPRAWPWFKTWNQSSYTRLIVWFISNTISPS